MSELSSGFWHHCPNCGEWCNCDILDEETGTENIYYCACDCPIFDVAETLIELCLTNIYK